MLVFSSLYDQKQNVCRGVVLDYILIVRNNALEVTIPNTHLGTGVTDFLTLSVSTTPTSPDATRARERLNKDATVTHL